MKRNMKSWLSCVLSTPQKGAMPILSFPAIQLMGITVKQLIGDSQKQSLGMQLVAKRAPSIASVSMMDLSVEAEGFGALVRVSDDEVPTVIGRIITNEADAKALKVPSVHCGRTALYIEAVRKAAALIEDRPVLAGCIGPFSLAGRLMNVSDIMVNCYDEPDMVHMTMEKTTQYLTDYVLAYKRAGANGVLMAEPLTGLLSPALADTFSSPYVKRIRDAVADETFLFIYHNCGNNVLPMLKSLLSIGADAYHFGNSIDMAKMMKQLPSDVVAMGNLDPAGVLRSATPQVVYQETMAMLNASAKYPNYIPSSGCDIPPATPWENIDAFFEAIGDFYSHI